LDQEFISKKELLELTGISYGQLYRWKRKNLIPEDWFIRKSTFTGQETFFPKKDILARIDKIVNMKDDLSLDELADVFSPAAGDFSIGSTQLLDRNIVSKVSLELYGHHFEAEGSLSFGRLLFVYMLDRLLQAGDISLDEGHMMLATLKDYEAQLEGKPWSLLFVRKMGIASFLVVGGAADVYFEAGTKVAARLSAAASIEALKLALNA